MADDIAQWLDGIGLGRYAQAFVENRIDLDVVPRLTENDFKDLGLPIGDRRRLQAAIENLAADRPDAPSISPRAREPDTQSPEAERRQLTVLFCDLVGSTALSAKLDAEDIREVIRAYQDAVAGVINRYDGFVAKYMGDGVLAYFGYPQAFENDAERAVNAGLGIVERVKGLAAPDGDMLAVRIGIATGTVVVGDIVGEGASQEAAITGETPNLAARLQEIAEPGWVVIGEATNTLASGLFETSDLGARDVKGFDAPVRAWAVRSARRTESRFEATRGMRLTKLVGRDEEIGILLRRWQRAKTGEGQVVLISGEPGIGKSRLAQELQERIAGEPHLRLRYQCSPHHTSSRLHPIIEHLERTARFEAVDGPEARLEKLEGLLSTAGRPDQKTVPLIASLLSLPIGNPYALPDVSPQRLKDLTLDALVGQLSDLAARQPVLFVFEDAHWIDPTTLELLEMTLERVPDMTVLALITHRPEFEAPWIGRARTTPIILGRLDRRDSERMVDEVTDRAAIPDALRDRISDQTDGVPLFIEELTKSVLETLSGADGVPEAIAVPMRLQDSLEARLDRLGRAKEIAQIGAVIGREFGYDLLARVAPFEEAELGDALDGLVRAELVFARGQLPDAVYTFKHALVQDTAYGSLLRGRRQELHRQIAERLRERSSGLGETAPEILAHHYTEAGDADIAIGHWEEAASRASGRSANPEALSHLDRALDLVRSLPEGRDRDGRELDLHALLISPLLGAKGFDAPEADRAYTRALELCERTGDTGRALTFLIGHCHYYMATNLSTKGLAIARDYQQRVAHAGDQSLILVGHRTIGLALLGTGSPAEAHEYFDRVRAQYETPVHRQLALKHGFDILSTSLSFGSLALWLLGYPDRARDWGSQSISHARAVAHAHSMANATGYAGVMLHGLIRDFDRVGRYIDELTALIDEFALGMWEKHLPLFLGWMLLDNGDRQDGLKLMGRYFGAPDKPYKIMFFPHFATLIAHALGRVGDLDGARHYLDEAAAVVEDGGERWADPEIWRVRGDLHATAGSRNDAEACYIKAIDIARSQSAKSWELRAATSLAALMQAQGKSSEARDLLAPIYGWFTEGFDTADLKEAKTLLDELS